ncbi:MAG: hypothetical protein JO187_04600, partial [Acidobacteria bacterium]|nr:hypothetical protein [Acidobacteriota bacterium]
MNHLHEDDIAGLLIGSEPASNACEQCIADLEHTRAQIDEARNGMMAAAERDEAFWTRQRALIRQRAEHGSGGAFLQWAASLAAVIAIAAMLIGSAGKPSQEVAQRNQPDPDYVLLAEIQETLARPLPAAVEPVRILASDMDQAW